jgi:hypothetical protein
MRMSTRLQVLMDDAELREIKKIAKRERMTVAEWVRRALADARRRSAVGGASRKFEVLRAAARHDFPTGPIESMLEEIERGYATDADRDAAHESS